MLRFLTAGESHGPSLVAVLDGMPAGCPIDVAAIDAELRRRQGGYGRGRRMAIESDRAEVVGGVRCGRTTGAPIAIRIANKDWPNWQKTMHVGPDVPADATGANRPPVTRPRPGHADLAGALKYDLADMRDVLERASARETAARVAVGAVARQLLAAFGVEILSHVTMVGGVGLDLADPVPVDRLRAIPDDSPLRCIDVEVETRMIAAIDRAREAGDTVGGAFEIVVTGVPPGLGSHVQWDRKLDGRLAQALMSIPAIKAVGIGLGTEVARRPGSAVHDEIVLAGDVSTGHPALGVSRPTNRAGGLEGGVTNGEAIRVSAFMKPISTLMAPLGSVDLATMQPSPAAIERSDVCAVTAASIVGEAMTALILADAWLETFSGDSMAAIARSYEAAVARIRHRFSATDPVPHR